MTYKKLIYNFFSLFNYLYFPISIFRYKKKIVEPFHKVYFPPAEEEFLQLSAASFNYTLDYSGGYTQKELSIYTLEDVIFLGNSGALVKQHRVITESVFDQVRMSISPAYRSPSIMLPKKKSGIFTSIIHLPWAQSSNFHWFYDCLPRLYSLLQVTNEPVQIIVNKDLPTFQLETLKYIILDFPHFTLAPISKFEKWKVEKFLFSSFVTNHSSGYLPSAIISLIQTKIWNGYGIKDDGTNARIYISRSKASKRKLLNEEQVIDILHRYNFQIIHAETLTYREQVNLFYNSSYIIGPHGAGFTNILFCRNAAILELQPADIIKPHYFLAAKSLGFSYSYLIGSGSDKKMNFYVDLKLFENQIIKMIG